MADYPFADLDTDREADHEAEELQVMITQAGIAEGTCSAKEFTSADDNLPVCQDFVDDTWMTDFLDEIGPRDKRDRLEDQEHEEEDEEDEEEDDCSKLVQPKLTTFKEVVQSLEDISAILDHRGYTSEATQVSHITDTVSALSYSVPSKRQATIDKFFQGFR